MNESELAFQLNEPNQYSKIIKINKVRIWGMDMKKLMKLVVLATTLVTVSFANEKVVKAEGWVQKPEGFYYVYDNGTIATNTQVGIFTVGPTGCITQAEAVEVTNRIIALQAQLQAAQAQNAQPQTQVAEPQTQVVTPAPVSGDDLYSKCVSIVSANVSPEMSEIDKTRALYNYMMAATAYKRDYITPAGNWGPAYAYECLSTGYGNCYRYAAAFAHLLKAAGIESRIAYGQIHAARGGLTPHSWTEINIGGAWYVVDCEMQDAKGTKYDFFMKTYDEYPVKPLVPQGYLPATF